MSKCDAAADPTTRSTILDFLRDHACNRPDDLAFEFLRDRGGRQDTLTYRDLDRASSLFARALDRRGFSGRNLVLMLPSSLEFIVALLGCFKIGAVAVPLPVPRKPADWGRLAAVRNTIDIAAGCVLARNPDIPQPTEMAEISLVAYPELMAEALEGTDSFGASPENIAYLQFTSGSTGEPKGVRVTHRNIVANNILSRDAFGTSPRSIGVGWLPMFHDMGLIGNLLHPLQVGFPATLLSPSAFLRRPRFWLETISKVRATISGAPNSAYQYCVERYASTDGLDLSCWEVAFCGAERIDAQTIATFTQIFAPAGFAAESFFPCYGLAEASLFVSGGPRRTSPRIGTFDAAALRSGLARDAEAGDLTAAVVVSCGRADPEHVAIVNDAGRPSRDGATGEIWVRGPSVADGYVERDGSSAFGRRMADGQGPWLATGDLGFIRKGELYVTGRRKELIIVNGANYVPHDLERAACLAAPELNPLACVAFAIEGVRPARIILVGEMRRDCRGEVDESDLARRVRAAIAEAFEIALDDVRVVRPGALPRTTSGKLERVRIRAAYETLGEVSRSPETIAAGGATTLRGIVAALSGQPETAVNLDRSARRNGLDSLRIYKLQVLVAEHLGLQADMDALLSDAPLADAFSPQDTSCTSNAPGAPSASRLSEGQLGLWMEQQRYPNSAIFTLCMAAGISPPPDATRLQTAFEAVLERHPLLRMNVESTSDGPHWVEHDRAGSSRFHLQHLDDEAEIDEQLARLAATPLRLGRDPLLQLHYLLHPGGGVVAVLAHHIVADAWSLQSLVKELEQAYRGAPLAPAAAYAEFVQWQAAWLNSERGAAARAFWDGLPLALPRLRWPGQCAALSDDLTAERHSFTLSPATAAKCRALAEKADATPFHVLLSVHALMLAQWTGETRPAVASPMFGRPGPRFEATQGFCVQTTLIQFDLEAHRDFHALLAWTRDTIRMAARHQWLAHARRRESDLAAPIQCLFTLHDPADSRLWPLLAGSGEPIEVGAWRLSAIATPPAERVEDLAVSILPTPTGWRVSFDYRTNRLDRRTVARMADHWQALLDTALADPSASLALLNASSSPDRSIVAEPALPPSKRSWLARVVARSVTSPEAPAIVHDGRATSYATLLARAEAIAEQLAAAGVRRGDRVAVLLDRSPDLVAALLAVLLTSAAYVPLDPAYPEPRLRLVAQRARPHALITDRTGRVRLDHSAPATLLLETLPERPSAARQPAAPHPEEAVAILFTSGSTGEPKGVIVRHGGLEALIDWAHRFYEPGLWRGVAATTSICFDLSLFELFTPLAIGGAIHLFDNALSLSETSAGPGAISLLNTVPSACRALLDQGAFPADASVLNLAGETLSAELVRDIHAVAPEVRIFNLYGPTEDTVYSTVAEMPAGLSGKPGIGRPLPGAEALILDPQMSPVPIGVIGELHLAGSGLSNGYFGRAGETALRFAPHPCPSTPGQRIYRTGDLARLRDDGALELMGRNDNQIKLRGFRIELEEIEATLRQLDGVKDAAVLLHRADYSPGADRLVAFVAASHGVTGDGLQKALLAKLPAHMAPAIIECLDALPRTPNGKVDRADLAARPVGRRSIEPPQSETERELIELWKKALGEQHLGATDDFLAMGGNSILAMKIIREMNARRGIAIDLAEIFDKRTVRQLSQHVERLERLAAMMPTGDDEELTGDLIEI
jgi:amino acid adenylation domain-containing protein